MRTYTLIFLLVTVSLPGFLSGCHTASPDPSKESDPHRSQVTHQLARQSEELDRNIMFSSWEETSDGILVILENGRAEEMLCQFRIRYQVPGGDWQTPKGDRTYRVRIPPGRKQSLALDDTGPVGDIRLLPVRTSEIRGTPARYDRGTRSK